MKLSILKSCLLTFTFLLSTTSSYADHLITCPSAQDLQSFTFDMAIPYAYNKNEKAVEFISLLVNAGNDITKARLGLVIYPVSVPFNQDPEATAKSLITQLVPETEQAVTYTYTKGHDVPMCIYSTSQNSQVTAFLFANDKEDNDPKLAREITDKRKHAMQFLQFIHVPSIRN